MMRDKTSAAYSYAKHHNRSGTWYRSIVLDANDLTSRTRVCQIQLCFTTVNVVLLQIAEYQIYGISS